jgi:hypothetical protein
MNSAFRKRELTLSDYVRRRNGVAMGAPGGLRGMLHRSLGAGSFGGFWRYWNPIWGYGLGKYVFTPLKTTLPPAFALLATFVVSGALHDLATMLVSRSAAFLFTPWFFLYGLGVLLGRAARMDLSARTWPVRAAVNLAYLTVSLAIALLIRGYVV